jgi:hypothetical protein
VINDEYISNRFQIGIEKLINETGLDAKMGIADYKLAYLLCEIIGVNLAAMHTFDSYKRGSFIAAMEDARQSIIEGQMSLPSKAVQGIDAALLSMRVGLPNSGLDGLTPPQQDRRAP